MRQQLLQITKFFIRKATLQKGETSFLNLVMTPKGNMFPMTNIEKQKINKDIDRKMQQLEDTGLSKEEILLSKARKGIPLKIDPFFQYLKHNHLAREVYLKPEQRFSLQKVIDLALRQDIGPDTSYSRVNLNQTTQSKMRAEHLDQLVQKDERGFDAENYYANSQFSTQKAFDGIKPHQSIRHIYRPIDKYERVKKNARKLKKYDIHWRNIELLRQFVTSNGNIKKRLTNCLTRVDQKKIQRAIKTARHMHAMPHYGQTPAPLRKSITSIEDEVQEIGQQHINLETGHIYFSRNRSMDSLQVENDKKGDIDSNFKKMQERGKNYKLWFQNADPLEKTADEQIIKSNMFARALKEHQVEANSTKSNKEKQAEKLAKSAYRKITGLTEEEQYQEFEFRYKKSDEPQCQEAFSKRASQFKREFSNNPYIFSEMLIREKTEF